MGYDDTLDNATRLTIHTIIYYFLYINLSCFNLLFLCDTDRIEHVESAGMIYSATHAIVQFKLIPLFLLVSAASSINLTYHLMLFQMYRSKMLWNIAFVVLSFLFTTSATVIHYQPEAVHLSYGGECFMILICEYISHAMTLGMIAIVSPDICIIKSIYYFFRSLNTLE